MNLIKSTLVGSAVAPMIRIGSHELAVDRVLAAARPSLARYIDREIVVGIRPEDLEDAAIQTGAAPDRTLQSVTMLVESLGSEIILHFPLDAEPFAIMDAEFEGEDAVAAAADAQGRFSYVARVSPRSAARIGEPISLTVDTSRLHFFDPSTGLAITD
jgi:multiple sugar transport system ATP-binding protein